MRILICDDEQKLIDLELSILQEYCRSTNIAATFFTFTDSLSAGNIGEFDIAFLDIDMEKLNGIELARKLRSKNPTSIIIFVTNFIQYAPEGYEVNAFRYLLSYCLSFTVGMTCSVIFGMDSNTFQASPICVIIYGIIAYSLQLFLALMFRKIMRPRRFGKNRHSLRISQIIMYGLFPSASFMVLIVLLYISTGRNVSEAILAFTCGLIIAANAAIIFLLERMEQAMEREQQLFSLGQQLEVQVRSMESASKLFSEQRKKVHDYRSHLNTLRVLLQNHEYEQAEVYLNSVSKQQTERLFLVNTHHSILDALFNTKASEAIQEGIEIDFRVNDLSMLPFEAADMVVLLSNLLDNAIEANRSYCGSKKIHVTALWEKSFLFSIRNTSNPVRIENNTIQTTKPDPQLHGFGLSNVKLILEKYNGDFTMDYEDNWFQFTGEISQ